MSYALRQARFYQSFPWLWSIVKLLSLFFWRRRIVADFFLLPSGQKTDVKGCYCPFVHWESCSRVDVNRLYWNSTSVTKAHENKQLFCPCHLTQAPTVSISLKIHFFAICSSFFNAEISSFLLVYRLHLLLQVLFCLQSSNKSIIIVNIYIYTTYLLFKKVNPTLHLQQIRAKQVVRCYAFRM